MKKILEDFDDMSQFVQCNFYLNADDACLVSQHKDINIFRKGTTLFNLK